MLSFGKKEKNEIFLTCVVRSLSLSIFPPLEWLGDQPRIPAIPSCVSDAAERRSRETVGGVSRNFSRRRRDRNAGMLSSVCCFEEERTLSAASIFLPELKFQVKFYVVLFLLR